jgi:DNA-directed RNA polymerase subunit RPC12/RpoP
MRQFCPEDLMLVNPNLIQSSNEKIKKASKEETHLSPDTDNGINAICKECKGEIAVSYNEKEAKTDFVCTQCGKRIPENKLSEKSKKAMRKIAFKNEENEDNQLANELVNIAKMLIKGE